MIAWIFITKGENVSKSGNIKKMMVELLSKKNMTLTELSVVLGLATSTVSRHLMELKEIEAIR